MYRLPLLVAALLALTGCPRQELYVVLPNADGRPGAGQITVMEGTTATVLNQPFAAAEARGGQSTGVPLDPTEARIVFNQAVAARPILPAHLRLYFVLGSDQLTPESTAAYRAVFDDIKRRPAYEVEVIGHTDTLGDVSYNQQLSLNRAAMIRASLTRDGVDPNAISIAGRGKLDLLVPTGDQVPEPQNRRVEITVR
jgi:outer membrane protein OmpA-like peptidoglycan-associated protein